MRAVEYVAATFTAAAVWLSVGPAWSGVTPAGSGTSGPVPSGEIAPAEIPPGHLKGAKSQARKPQIALPQAKPHGKSYSQWAAEWWQWAVETPASVNPVLDTTGAHCAEGQRGHVWFLAGSFGSQPVTRTCTVKTGTALLIPLMNRAYLSDETDPWWKVDPSDPSWSTIEPQLREKTACLEAAPPELTLTIDGKAVANLSSYYEESVVFEVVVGEDSILGSGYAVGYELRPSVDAGYYVLVNPLTPGQHTIRWTGTSTACGFSQDITYNLTVQAGKAGRKKSKPE